ncbi:MORN repeat-containing protein isoform 1 [Tripterygium wilfordii]|uniref:MORN repeat-containing protein isoform 1 n=1 Tax=Tripterygium wilfordii TaxID=458696 RepID=A0A7J7C0W5_TRIWF|nr:protein TIC 100 [Tripterygium wilfordii]XP_038693489.1 protein TIC 100 [Tripterygium wilfordii]KAF5727507.1 MORN repeat-containing protein isoform 1 [Tripterygium wilfordii]
MANEDSDNPADSQQQEEQEDTNQEQEDQNEVDEDDVKWSSSSSSNSDSDYGSDYESYSDYDYTTESQQQEQQQADPLLSNIRRGRGPQDTEDNTPEANFRRYAEVLDSSVREWEEEEDREYEYYEDLYNFPKDPENWREEDLKELWADAPVGMTKPGWDPVWADEEDWEVVNEEIREGRDPPIAPFYVPYRKPYPVIPDNHYDISNPKAVIEELDRIEEFLKWVSYIFPDGSSYEGTVWDDLAHGKGVYVDEIGLVRYEGEWLRNDMEGHGVVEVDIPEMEPLPGSELEKKMRAEGHVFSRDFLPPEDKEWLEMDIEDSVQLAGGNYEIPFYERDTWIKEFGRKPEKGRYRYAGQWKQGRMHGCGIYEVNERSIYGRFYFGELLEEDDDYGCDEETSTLHAGIAEVAAAKARMFVNKPDGMVREQRGPYSDPQHPYFYEEDDVWMAPGFINQFYEVPDYWKTYVHDVDQERELWLNSFYKAPLRLPMPAELEYWWSKEEEPEFVLINKEPEADPEDPSKLVYTEDPLILHTPTGRIINYVDDEKHGIRLFWQPPLKDGEEPDPERVELLPLGFDEFYGRDTTEKKESKWKRLVMAIENTCKPVFDKLDKWTEEKKKDSEMKIKLYEKELELIEAELCLEEAIEDMDEELKMQEEEEAAEMDYPEEEDISSSTKEDISASTKDDISASAKEDEKSYPQDEDEEEEEEEEDFGEPSNFGSVTTDQEPEKKEQKGNKPGDSPFSASSLSFASRSFVSSVPSMLRKPMLLWKKHKCPPRPIYLSHVEDFNGTLKTFDFVSFPRELGVKGGLRAKRPANVKSQARKHSSEAISPLRSLSRHLLHPSALVSHKSFPKVSRTRNSTLQHAAPKTHLDSILSLHLPLYGMEPPQHAIVCEPLQAFSEVK